MSSQDPFEGPGHDRIEDLILEVPNDLQAIDETVERVLATCAACTEAQRDLGLNLRVSLHEALANAMIYGNGGHPEKRVRLEVRIAEGTITARISDEGAGFDPSCVPDPTADDNLDAPTGRGLFLMRKLMDEVHYNECGNCVTLVLRLGRRRDLGEAASA